jgi:alpha-1,3-rhamnosyl/mannosyltransferase
MNHYVLDARTATPHFPGIGRYVTNLARAIAPLLASDEQMTVLHDPAHPPALAPTEAIALRPVSASPFSLQQQWAIPGLLREMAILGQWAAGGRRSAVLYHSAYYLMPYLPRVPTVLTVYDLIPLLFPEYVSVRARLLFRLTTALALRTARVVIAISEATRCDFWARFGVPAERIITVPLAADPIFTSAALHPQGMPIVGKQTLPDQYALYFGSNKPHKNLPRLAKAWQLAQRSGQLAGCKLVIAGAWDARYPQAKQQVEALGITDQVRFLGPVSEADLPALYAHASLFLFPSLYEGFGLPVLEAMACGVPVVCSNTTSLAEVAGDAAIQVDPLDEAALADAIARVLTTADLQADLRRRSLAQASRFTWEATARRTLEIYRTALA